MPTSFKADTIKINNIESTGSVGSAGNRWAVVKVSASLHLLNTSSIRFNDSTEISSSKAGVLNFYAVDTYFSSSVKILNLTGAIHNLPSGLTYLQAGSGITITSGANSQVTIAAPSTTTFDNQVPYVTLNATSSLSSERVLTGSDGIVLVDGGAGAAVTLSANGTVARISGSRFVGNITVTGTGSFETGMSGSLTRLTDGTSFMIAGQNMTVVSSSAGITINAASPAFDDKATYIVISTTSSLANERSLAAGDGLTLADAGAGSTATLAANGTVARISGSRFVGNVTITGTGSFESGLSGSLTKLVDGTSYLIAGSNVTISSASAGITISTPSLTTFDDKATYVVISTTSSLANERSLAAGTGLTLVDAGAGSTVTLAVDGTVARISGSRFTGGITVANTGSFETGLTVGGTTAATVYFNTGTLPANTKIGTDVLTFISGVRDSQGTTTQGTALFSGDVATSGTFVYASATLANINIPAAGFVGDGNSTFVGNLAFNGTASYWTNNPGGTQGVHVACLNFPPDVTITAVTVHLSRSATQASQVALFRQNITSSQHTLVASTTFTTKGEFINVSLNNLSHSVEPAGSTTQYAYYLSVVQGIAGQTDRHRLHGAKASYYYNKIVF